MKTRDEVAAYAREFCGTPYHLGGMLKGVGVDCASLLFIILRDCNLIAEEEFGVFQQDWWAHTTEEIYLHRMLRHAGKVAETICLQSTETLPGNIVLCKSPTSRVYNHGALVTQWPLAVEAVAPAVRETRISLTPMWLGRQMVIFDPWRKG